MFKFNVMVFHLSGKKMKKRHIFVAFEVENLNNCFEELKNVLNFCKIRTDYYFYRLYKLKYCDF